MAPPSSISPSLPLPSHLFTPIHEGNESEETEERHRFGSTTPSTLPSSSCTESIYHHNPTPLHQPGSKKPTRKLKPSPSNHHIVSCTNCRPTTREKTSVIVVPVDHHHHHNSLSSTSSPSPNRLFKSLISGISRRTPKSAADPSKTPPYTEEQWRITVAELSHKLSQATRRRDEAILEASRLKYSMSELENKLNRLEVYCHNLQSGLEICNQAQAQAQIQSPLIVNSFLVSVSDARTSIRFLSKALSSQLKLMGVKVLERLSIVLKSYDFKIISSSSTTQNNIQYNKSLQYYLEAVLSRVFYQDFESSGFGSSMDQILNPIDRCEANYSAYTGLKDLTWDQVLNKGTKHFSEEFSRFCDRKMSEIVGLLGWTRAWPEKLLETFFGASKSVWLVHLLANSIHPRLMIFRVEKGVRFDPVYMEDMGGDKTKKLIPTMVKIMVEPGFYVYDNVVKCKVISKYYNYNSNNNNNSNDGSVFSDNDV